MVKVNDKLEDLSNVYGPQSSMSSDGSFVVLERSPPQEPSGQFSLCPPSFPQNNGINGQQQSDGQSSSFIPGSMPSDLSPEEIQKKLNEVLQENVELKETLHQNNLAMKQQFNTLVMWQDEVFKVHQSHKEKFAETKDLILKLRAENAELKNYLEQTKAGSISDAQLKAENASLKGKIAELEQKLALPSPRKDAPGGAPSRKERELSELSEQLSRQLETAERARRQLSMDNERLAAQKTRQERETEELRSRCEGLRVERDQLQARVIQQEKELHEKSVKQPTTSNARFEEVQQLQMTLSKQQAQMEALQQQLLHEREMAAKQKKQEPPSQGSGVSPEDGAFITTNLKSCEENLQQFNISLEKQTERYASLDEWLQGAAENVNQIKARHLADPKTINNLRAEVGDLRKLLAQEQAYGEEKKQNLAVAQSQFQKLYTDYNSLLEEWEVYREEQKNKSRHDSAYYDIQARGFSEKLDGLTAQLLCKEEELSLKEKEIAQLSDKVKKLEVENEAITILKAQVEVYQSDFNAEREARENLAGEKERLAEDLRHLQRRNQQLLDDLENSRKNQHKPTAPNNGWSTIATPGRTVTNNSRIQRRSEERVEDRPQRIYDEDVPPPKEYFCPKCNMSFRQIGLLEYHVETCLELTN